MATGRGRKLLIDKKSQQGAENSNYVFLLYSGIFGSVAGLLASPGLVLPFLYLALGAPQIIAALLLPAVTAAGLISEFFIAPSLRGIDRAKLATVLPNLVTAGALAVIALLAGRLDPWLAAILFVLVAIIMGLAEGVLELGISQVYGLAMSDEKRAQMAYLQIGVSCLIAIALTWATHVLLASETPYERHLVVLWIGIAALILSALALMRLRLATLDTPAKKIEYTSLSSRLTQGFHAGLRQTWYRRYVAGRFFFISIELALPFYTIHAATTHTTSYHSLSVFVISASAGTAVGAALWRRISRRSLTDCIFYGAAASALAAFFVLSFNWLGLTVHAWSYAVSIFLLSIGIGGVGTGRYLYIVAMSADDERPSLIAFSDVLAGSFGIAFAAALGAAAHLANESVPLMVLIALNIGAAFMAYRLIPPRGARA